MNRLCEVCFCESHLPDYGEWKELDFVCEFCGFRSELLKNLPEKESRSLLSALREEFLRIVMSTKGESMDDYKILVVGGMKKNIPVEFNCKFEHIDVHNANRRDLPADGKQPDIVLAFKQFISHGAHEKFCKQAKDRGVPFVSCKGGFNAILAYAKERGHDLSKYIDNGKEEVETTTPSATPLPETRPREDVLEAAAVFEVPAECIHADRLAVFNAYRDKMKWVARLPYSAKRVELDHPTTPFVFVQPRDNGQTLIMKHLLLLDALAFVHGERLGTGKTGQLTCAEASKVQQHLLSHLPAETAMAPVRSIVQAVGLTMNTFTRKQLESLERHGRKPVSLVGPSAAKTRRETTPPPPPAAAPEPPAKPAPEPAPALPADRKTSDVSGLLDSQARLYERIIKLTEENAAFIEQIAVLEKQVASLKTENKELAELAKQYKGMLK